MSIKGKITETLAAAAIVVGAPFTAHGDVAKPPPSTAISDQDAAARLELINACFITLMPGHISVNENPPGSGKLSIKSLTINGIALDGLPILKEGNSDSREYGLWSLHKDIKFPTLQILAEKGGAQVVAQWNKYRNDHNGALKELAPRYYVSMPSEGAQGTVYLNQHIFRFGAQDYTGIHLSSVDLQKQMLDSKILNNAEFREALLNNADLSGASLKHADFKKANIENADFSGADLSGANLTGVLGADTIKVNERTNLTGTIIDRATYHAASDDFKLIWAIQNPIMAKQFLKESAAQIAPNR